MFGNVRSPALESTMSLALVRRAQQSSKMGSPKPVKQVNNNLRLCVVGVRPLFSMLGTDEAVMVIYELATQLHT